MSSQPAEFRRLPASTENPEEEAEGTDIKTSLLVYDEFDGRSLTFACLKKVSDPTLILAVTLLT